MKKLDAEKYAEKKSLMINKLILMKSIATLLRQLTELLSEDDNLVVNHFDEVINLIVAFEEDADRMKEESKQMMVEFFTDTEIE